MSSPHHATALSRYSRVKYRCGPALRIFPPARVHVHAYVHVHAHVHVHVHVHVNMSHMHGCNVPAEGGTVPVLHTGVTGQGSGMVGR